MEFENDGYEVVQDFISPGEIDALLTVLHEYKIGALRGGIRNIDRIAPDVAALAKEPRLLSAARRRLSGIPRLVRAIYFEKSPANNWLVTWHQDRTVAVSERFDAPGWGPWSRKDEVWHVQPPLCVLEDMVAIRIHLDPATTKNGCLKILPGSHKAGLLAAAAVSAYIGNHRAIYCEVARGGALIMRPHVLHASEKAVLPDPRRVLHFEYSSYGLPDGITWLG